MIGAEEKKAVVDLFPFLGASPIVFDIGSNKGGFADIFLEEYKDECMLFLFEPNKKLLSYTEIKYEYQKNIIYVSDAAYKENTKLPFFYFENYNNELSSIYNEPEGWKGLPLKEGIVNAITLDYYCKESKIDHIDYLKIDAEGAEVDVLLGCKQLITEGRVKIFQVEYGGHYPRANHTFQEVIDMFKNTGYKIYRCTEGNYWELNNFTEDFSAVDFIITKEEIRNYCVSGWNNQFVINTLELPKSDLCLEIGGFEGMTTKYICEKLLNPGGRVIVIDPMEEYYIEGDTEHPQFKGQYPRFKRNTRGLPVELKRGKSEQELPKLHSLRFDLIYVDGDHRKEPVYFDLCWSFAVCKLQGFILIDDYTWRPETTEGIDKFLNEFSGSFDLVTKGYQVLIRKHTNQYNELTYNFYV